MIDNRLRNNDQFVPFKAEKPAKVAVLMVNEIVRVERELNEVTAVNHGAAARAENWNVVFFRHRKIVKSYEEKMCCCPVRAEVIILFRIPVVNFGHGLAK